MSKDKKSDDLSKLQLSLLKIQQGLHQRKERAIIIFEGMDAAGKGGAIKRLTESLDQRGVRVYPISAPTADEQGRHWLWRFWRHLPPPGRLVIFDRSWYGRVLVERVEGFAKPEAWKRAYEEIDQFEKMLVNDGVHLIKFYLDVSKEEQLKRFLSRINDPLKQHKITPEDIRNRAKWDKYAVAVADMLKSSEKCGLPWHVIPADDKQKARRKVMQAVISDMKDFEKWVDAHRDEKVRKQLMKDLQKLEKQKF